MEHLKLSDQQSLETTIGAAIKLHHDEEIQLLKVSLAKTVIACNFNISIPLIQSLYMQARQNQYVILSFINPRMTVV